MGSGLATFSRFPIVQAFFKRFTLNGEPHRIFHGDWFSGKGVGACRILIPSTSDSDESAMTLDFYNTHLHAEYDCHTDFYMVHRLCQLQELVQFVELSSREDCLVAIVGDLNTIPDSFPYELLFAKGALSSHAKLVDTWQACNTSAPSGRIFAKGKTTAPEAIEAVGYTFNLPRNSYHTDGPIEKLDYVLVAERQGLRVIHAGVLAEDRVLGSDVSLSDHSLVQATLHYDSNSKTSTLSATVSTAEKIKAAKEAIEVIRGEIQRVKSSIHFFHVLLASLTAACILLFLACLLTFILEVISTGVMFAMFCLQPILLTGAVLAEHGKHNAS